MNATRLAEIAKDVEEATTAVRVAKHAASVYGLKRAQHRLDQALAAEGRAAREIRTHRGVVVRFENVGPSRRRWIASFPGEVTEARLYRSVRKSGALGSRGVDFTFDGRSGEIYVGLIRCVGSFRVVTPCSPSPAGVGLL